MRVFSKIKAAFFRHTVCRWRGHDHPAQILCSDRVFYACKRCGLGIGGETFEEWISKDPVSPPLSDEDRELVEGYR